MRKFALLIIIISRIILFQNQATAQPPLPAGYYGTISINGQLAPVGTIIVPLIRGVAYPASDTVKTAGNYGLLFVHADDPSTPSTKEGGVFGDSVVFKAITQLNEYIMTPSGAWASGVNQQLNLINQDYIPVELSSFYASINHDAVLLSWTTASESNNFGFEVQKSRDNKSYTKIGFVQGHGTTSVVQRYQFEDQTQSSGIYFYRLKQIDTDGSFEFSSSVKVDVALPDIISLEQNYPNPFNPTTTIRFKTPQKDRASLTIFNIKGEFIRCLIDDNLESGQYTIHWNGDNAQGKQVPNGIYIYSLQSGSSRISKKMILVE